MLLPSPLGMNYVVFPLIDINDSNTWQTYETGYQALGEHHSRMHGETKRSSLCYFRASAAPV